MRFSVSFLTQVAVVFSKNWIVIGIMIKLIYTSYTVIVHQAGKVKGNRVMPHLHHNNIIKKNKKKKKKWPLRLVYCGV